MPRLFRYWAAIIISLAVISANSAAVKSSAIPTPQYDATAQGIPLASFTAIYASGNINIIINPPVKSQFAYSAPPSISVQMRDRALYISSLHQGPVQTVILWANNLSGIYLSSNVNLTAEQFTSPALYLSLTDYSSVRLRGKIGLKQLLDSSNGMVDIQWVDTRQLLLQSTANGMIRLAGVAQLLDAKVFGKSILDAKYLRAKNVLAQTGQYGFIEVLPLNSLAAFAGDHSNIYYYKTPQQLTRDSRNAGNVLQMNYWR